MRTTDPRFRRDSSPGPGRGSAPGPPRPSAPADPPPIVDDTAAVAILDGDSARLVQAAEQLGGRLAEDKLQTSQIRNIFGAVRRIEMRWPRTGADDDQRREAVHQLRMLKPKLAYQVARHRDKESGAALRQLEKNLLPLINGVGEDRERFQRFVDFFEATLAYHRAKGGRD